MRLAGPQVELEAVLSSFMAGLPQFLWKTLRKNFDCPRQTRERPECTTLQQ
jgi:hypothetical protein